LISLEIQGIFIPPDQQNLVLLEQKNGGMSRKGHVNAMIDDAVTPDARWERTKVWGVVTP
jgi:hypothetical protein